MYYNKYRDVKVIKLLQFSGGFMEQEKMIEELIQLMKSLLNIELNPEDVKQLLLLANMKMFKKNDIILGMGEESKYTGFVWRGIIRSYYLDEQGNDITKNFHTENYLFMDEGLVGYITSTCAYEALEDSTVLLFPTKQIKEEIMGSESLKNLYLASLEWGIRYKLQRENTFLTCNATERYQIFKKEYPNLIDRIKQSYIATYLGITPESLSRIRRTLRDNSGSINN